MEKITFEKRIESQQRKLEELYGKYFSFNDCLSEEKGGASSKR